MTILNVMIADDQPVFVEGLKSVLTAQSGAHKPFSVAGVARSGPQLLDLLRLMRADLLIMDLSLPETDNLKMVSTLKKLYPDMRLLVLTSYDDARLVKATFKAGADGYMLKSSGKEELYRAIDDIMHGQTYVGRGVVLADQRPGASSSGALLENRFARRFGLTRREMEIMQYIGQAMNNKDIAGKLFISDQTVSVHRKNIMRKLGVNNTASLIKIAFENNLVG
jgi:two-component system NarL family response regulator